MKSSPCLCTVNDFECSIQFQMINKKCVPLNDNVNAKPKKCSGYYLGSSGYRKIPGNDCKGGNQMDK
jgi:hypothetical protein